MPLRQLSQFNNRWAVTTRNNPYSRHLKITTMTSRRGVAFTTWTALTRQPYTALSQHRHHSRPTTISWRTTAIARQAKLSSTNSCSSRQHHPIRPTRIQRVKVSFFLKRARRQIRKSWSRTRLENKTNKSCTAWRNHLLKLISWRAWAAPQTR